MELMRSGTELPQLMIVPTRSVVPHERYEAQRSMPLVARLRQEGILKNPPLVAPIPDEERFVILDGTNRAMAIAALDYPHMLVQVINYEEPRLILDTWFHLVSEMPRDQFLARMHEIDGLRIEQAELLHARAELARREAGAYVIVPNAESSGVGQVYVLYVGNDLHRRADILNDLVNVYLVDGHIYRANTDHFNELLNYYDDVTALIVFPRYEPSEIVELARVGAYLPPGITRHVIPGRALRVNFPISILAESQPIEEKNEWLQEWLRNRLASNSIRYYQESTYLFDE